MIFARTICLVAGLWVVLSTALLAPVSWIGPTDWGVDYSERDSSASWPVGVDASGAASLDQDDDRSDHFVIDTSHMQWEASRAHYSRLWITQLPTEPPAVFLRPPDAA